MNTKRDNFFVTRNGMEIPDFIFNPAGVVVTLFCNVHPRSGWTLKFNPFGV